MYTKCGTGLKGHIPAHLTELIAVINGIWLNDWYLIFFGHQQVRNITCYVWYRVTAGIQKKILEEDFKVYNLQTKWIFKPQYFQKAHLINDTVIFVSEIKFIAQNIIINCSY